ncbi:predicted transcription regulator [Bacillus phage 0305phi8-36]|uniref:predicted transcription regulator n=1 Tax=Bacillus phage 0305phi8-36 TaxID=458639 RepID=UPI00015A1F40|nr:predicted transcription regulator [Bacillus phage 0305phi8-36]ABS83766.1 predicted transcription regulator [Bacillus phage 0305phi8-36]
MTAKAKKPRYAGAYNRLFPVKVSTSTFLTIYILHLLTRKERLYGKEIINEIENRFAGEWKPSHGLVYPILRELEAEGLVKGHWIGESSKKTIRTYSITKKGKAAYIEEKEKHKDAFSKSFFMMETLLGDLYTDFEMIDIEDLK